MARDRGQTVCLITRITRTKWHHGWTVELESQRRQDQVEGRCGGLTVAAGPVTLMKYGPFGVSTTTARMLKFRLVVALGRTGADFGDIGTADVNRGDLQVADVEGGAPGSLHGGAVRLPHGHPLRAKTRTRTTRIITESTDTKTNTDCADSHGLHGPTLWVERKDGGHRFSRNARTHVRTPVKDKTGAART